jgi:hypothetical protein
MDNPVATWKDRYTAAILEIDEAKIPLRVHDAKMANCDRVEEVNGRGDVASGLLLTAR